MDIPDNSNNPNNPGSPYDDNNQLFEPANNLSNPYELFDNNIPYEQNNNFDNNAQYEQSNNIDYTSPYNLDNNFNNGMQYDQANNFDNNIQYSQDTNFDNGMQYSQDNSFDNSMQYSQDNNFDTGMQYEQVNNDVNSYQSFENTNAQYNQVNNFDNNMQYSQDNSFDNGMQYSQNNNFDNGIQYGQTTNDVNSYQSFENTNTQYTQNNNFDNGMNTGYGYSDGSDYASDFEKAWMGNIYDKAHSKKFNWCSALFNGAYFMYRKMYVSGLLFVILFNLTMLIPSLMFFGGILKSVALYTALAIILPLIFIILFGFLFYPLYKSFVNKKFNSLKTTIADNSALINEANTKGGTSALGVVIALIVSAIITSVGLGTTISNSIEKLSNKLPNEELGGSDNETVEPVADMKSYNFLNEYSVQYDSLNWFFNPIDNTLTKGNYSLAYSGQYLDNLKNNFNVDVTTPTGRTSLLNTIVSNLESQAAAINLSLEVVTNNFASGNDSYYAYLDIISDTATSRYYLLLLPEKDILFQFILSSNDTNIDYATNLEVINILTSISAEEVNDPNNENSNAISNEITNQISNAISNEVPSGLISNQIGNSVSNNTSNNVVSNSTSDSNQVPLQSILN